LDFIVVLREGTIKLRTEHRRAPLRPSRGLPHRLSLPARLLLQRLLGSLASRLQPATPQRPDGYVSKQLTKQLPPDLSTSSSRCGFSRGSATST
jgi:hypothetical protein